MKIFITAQSNDINSKMDSRFGRCRFFHIYDTETKKTQILENPGFDARGGAGIQTANFILDNNADVLITGQLGPNASEIIKNSNVRVFISEEKNILEIIEDYINNNLK